MPEVENTQTCPKCQMPFKKTGSGSLTQWIRVCNCGRQNEEVSTAAPIEVCSACGKRIEAGRAGTLTQWIFRADLCSCDVPSIVKSNEVQNENRIEEFDAQADLEELPLDAAIFPLERYAPLSLLGTGAAGSVYLCKDRLLNKRVAVKVLNNLSAEQVVAFQREAKATNQIEHPNIVKILDFGVMDGKFPYMVLEYINGISLEKLLEQRPYLRLEEALAIFDQVCDALIFSHSHELFHRDLKPSNIIVTGSDTTEQLGAHLIDFGVGLFKHEETASGKNAVGTPAYMSPDVAHGKAFDERSEVYSLGCVLYEVLSGHTPFQADTPLEVMALHANEKPKSLFEATMFSREYSDHVEGVVATCLQKSPADRFQNVQEVKDALAELAQEIPKESESATVESVTPHANPLATKTLPIFLSIGFILVAAVCGVTYFLQNKEPALKDIGNTKRSTESTPKLADVLNSLESDVWQRGFDDIGYEGWSSGPTVTDEDFKKLVGEKDLEQIFVGVTDTVTGVGFKYVANHNIERIALKSTGLNDAGLAEIAKIKTLRALRITLASNITAAGLRKLSVLTGLRAIELCVLNLPDGAIEAISPLSNLRSLSFYHARNLHTKDIALLQRSMPKLSYLDLTGAHLANDVLPIVGKMKGLEEARLGALDLNDEHLESLCELPELANLSLFDNPRITDKGLLKLTQCPKLESLRLDNCKGITSEGRAAFKRKRPDVAIGTARDTGTVIMRSIESLSD